MATTYLGLATPTTGAEAGTWGDTVNNNVSGYLDDYFAKPLALSLASSNVTLTQAQARCQMIRMTGVLLGDITISPDTGVLWNGFRCVQNLTTGSFSVTFSNAGGSVVIPQGRNVIVFLDTTNGPRIMSVAGSSTADPVPVGTKWAFYQAAAPSGYTQDTSLNDYAIRIVDSTGAGTGGSVNFSTLFARTSVDEYTLQIADIPSHSHAFPSGTGSGASGFITNGGNFASFQSGSSGNLGVGSPTAATGGGGAHTHAIDMRVKYADFIIAARA